MSASARKFNTATECDRLSLGCVTVYRSALSACPICVCIGLTTDQLDLHRIAHLFYHHHIFIAQGPSPLPTYTPLYRFHLARYSVHVPAHTATTISPRRTTAHPTRDILYASHQPLRFAELFSCVSGRHFRRHFRHLRIHILYHNHC